MRSRARNGGRFGLPAAPEASSAEALAAGALRRLSEEIVVDGLPLRVSASIGIAFHPRDGGNADELLHSADAAMYAAKQSGRNTFCVFEAQMNQSALKSLILQRDLHRALSDGELSMSFQPKFSVASQSVTGVEALIRWRHPELGEIAPLEFIPLAERPLPASEFLAFLRCSADRIVGAGSACAAPAG
ncbi:EAL domain-containing protein [Paraburkholderia panacisoli]|uniref:EAL domain-containing protein n=1 Tax=Paraburkholderia panacisoli TaxID=2603818 RepID=UPI001FE4CC24|nr:EAL domain-containing protein [Paraburkholderia panacisoli]